MSLFQKSPLKETIFCKRNLLRFAILVQIKPDQRGKFKKRGLLSGFICHRVRFAILVLESRNRIAKRAPNWYSNSHLYISNVSWFSYKLNWTNGKNSNSEGFWVDVYVIVWVFVTLYANLYENRETCSDPLSLPENPKGKRIAVRITYI